MAFFHDEKDSLEQLLSDVKLGDNPQHSDNPDSVRQSAREELVRRGYSKNEIDDFQNR